MPYRQQNIPQNEQSYATTLSGKWTQTRNLFMSSRRYFTISAVLWTLTMYLLLFFEAWCRKVNWEPGQYLIRNLAHLLVDRSQCAKGIGQSSSVNKPPTVHFITYEWNIPWWQWKMIHTFMTIGLIINYHKYLISPSFIHAMCV